MKKRKSKPKDETRERVHLMLDKGLMAWMRIRARTENRMLSRQIEVILEQERQRS